MAQSPIDEHEQLPWTARVYAMLPMTPVRVGFLIGAVLLTALLVSEWVLGRYALMLDDATTASMIVDFRIAVVHCLLTAYAPTAYVVLIRRTRRTWLELQDLLGLSASEIQAAMRRVDHRPPWLIGSFLILGLLVWLFVTYSTTPGNPFDTTVIVPEVVWHRVLSPIVIIYTLWCTIFIVTRSRALSEAARSISSLDLLDPDQIAPFKSQALTHSLVIFGMAACASPLGFEEHLIGLIFSIWIFGVLVASFGLLVPLLGVRDAIRTSRARELAWCDARLRSARDDLKRANSAAQTGRFAELYAYRQRLEDVSEWPLDAPSFVRFSLYLLIPLGSWLGGALVERLVDAVAQ